MSEEYQYSNPFFLAGRMAAELGESREACPYDYLKVADTEVISEHYRQSEWLAGFNSFEVSAHE